MQISYILKLYNHMPKLQTPVKPKLFKKKQTPPTILMQALHYAEFFAGVGNVEREVHRDGYNSVALDVNYGARFGRFDPWCAFTRTNPFDILTPSGLGFQG